MRPFSLFLHSFGVLCLVSFVASTPIDGLGLFGDDSDSPSSQPSAEQSYQPEDSSGDSPAKVHPPTETSHTDTRHSLNLALAHFIVGNTHDYQDRDWRSDIQLASDTGIDGFVLNVGKDPWEFDRVNTVFNIALDYPGFSLCISFDMSSLPCSNYDDTRLLQDYILQFQSHPSYINIGDRPFFTSFSGQDCTFGQKSPQDGWVDAITSDPNQPILFVPSFFVDPSTYSRWDGVIDGISNWNAAWPNGNNPSEFDRDDDCIANLGGKLYMTGVSPWFFTHYSFKNFIYQFDDWMFARRWELLINNRRKVDIAQVLTWNDFGESHYLGQVLPETDQPNSQAWVNGFDHTGWLGLWSYYIEAFKSGSYPSIEQDRIFLWSRLYPVASSTPDPLGKPDNWQWTDDYVWAIFLLSAPADVVLRCGSDEKREFHDTGLVKLKLALASTCSISASIAREDGSGQDLAPAGMEFTTEPQETYNFNAFVAAS